MAHTWRSIVLITYLVTGYKYMDLQLWVARAPALQFNLLGTRFLRDLGNQQLLLVQRHRVLYSSMAVTQKECLRDLRVMLVWEGDYGGPL